MSKNMTRKGLALGAAGALIVTSLVSVPAAQAAETLTLAPSAGSTYNTLNTSTFTLNAGIPTSVVADAYKYLKYSVVNSSEQDVRVEMNRGSSNGALSSFQTGTASTQATLSNTADSIADVGVTDNGNTDTVALTVAAGAASRFEIGDTILVENFAGEITAGNVALLAAGVNGYRVVTNVTDTVVTFVGGAVTGATSGAAANTASAGTIKNVSRTKDDKFVVLPADNTAVPAAALGSVAALKLSTKVLTADTTLTVQAWLDTNGNNTIDTGEDTSPVRTLSFLRVSTLTGSVALQPVAVNATSLKAYVTISGDINYRQVDAGDVLVEFGSGASATIIPTFADSATAPTADGTTAVTATDSIASNPNDLAWNSTDGTWEAVFNPFDTANPGPADLAVAAGTRYTAKLLFANGNDAVVNDQEGEISALTAAADGAAYALEAKVVDKAGVKTTQTARNDATATVTAWAAAPDRVGTAVVKTNAQTFRVQLFVGSNADVPVGVSDIPVAVTVSSTNLEADDNVTADGKTVFNGQSRSFTITTGTGGLASFEIVGAKADDAESIIVNFTAPNLDLNGGDDLTITFNDSVYGLSALFADSSRTITAATSYSLEYGVVDQWGIAPDNNTHRVFVVDSENETRTTAADFELTAPVVDGKATVSVKDNGVGTGRYKTVATLATNSSATPIGSTVTHTINVVADATPKTLTLAKLAYGSDQAVDANNDGDYTDTGDTDNTSKLVLMNKTFANFDSRYAIPGTEAPEVTAARAVTVGGTLTNAAGSAIAGFPVKLSAKGFQFAVGTTRYGADEITVVTGSDGKFSVDVWSNVGGVQTITMAAGAVTATQSLTFAAGTATAADFTITAATTSEPGKTVDVKVSVKDKFGNAAQGVAVTLRSTGPGYLLQTSITTDKLGEAFTKLLVGASEAGSAVVVATMTIAGVETSKSATIAIGAAEATAVVGSFNGRVAVRVENAKGSTVSVKIGKSWYKYTAISNNYLQSWKSRKGTSVAVSVYVDGELQNVQTITVK